MDTDVVMNVVADLATNGDPSVIREVDRLDGAELREYAVAAIRRIKESGWRLALAIDRAAREGQFVGWGYNRVTEWAKCELGLSDSVVSRFRKLAQFYRQLPPSGQDQWRGLTVWDAVELLPVAREDPVKALSIAEQAQSPAELRHLVRRETKSTQHRDDEYRQYSVTYGKSLSPLLERMRNRARFEAHRQAPGEDVIFEWMVSSVLSAELDPEFCRYVNHNTGIAMENVKTWIEDGNFQCMECGTWDARTLTFHHVVAKSSFAQNAEGETVRGHDGPVAVLCRDCHAKIQPTHREWAIEKGFLTEDGKIVEFAA